MKKKTVFITGGSRGIGKAIVSELKKHSYNIIAPKENELDLSDEKSIEKYIEKNKKIKIDIIINNAGINYPQWIDSEMSDDNIQNHFKINLIAPIKFVRGLSKWMIKNKWGRVVNISSAFGIVARGKQTLYTSTKWGINGFTKALALEYAKYNILVNSVCPGFTETELVTRNPKRKIKLLEKDIPLGRLAKPKEIAKLVTFLISDENSYMTGSLVIIDGGFVSK